jgi:hypothetical protein
MTWSGPAGREAPGGPCYDITNDIRTQTGARAGLIKLGLDFHASSIVVARQIDAQVPRPAERITQEQFPAFARPQLHRAEEANSC